MSVTGYLWEGPFKIFHEIPSEQFTKMWYAFGADSSRWSQISYHRQNTRSVRTILE